MSLNVYLYSACCAVYATLSILIAAQARQRANAMLAACCAVTALWAAAGALNAPEPLEGTTGLLDLARILTWYTYLLYLYYKSEVATPIQLRSFSVVAITAAFAALALSLTSLGGPIPHSIFSWPIMLRLVTCIVELLLIENLYFNLPESARWHIALPCVMLAGLACFDILIATDTAIFQVSSSPLGSGRVLATITVAPFLVLAAFRSQRWREPIRLSRSAVFHSATLVLSGSVLLSLAIAGEVLRHLDETWGWIAELGLIFSGALCILLLASSRSARSLIDHLVVYHFFADRYDYRRQWLSCIRTLSGSESVEQSDLHRRATKAVADVVNSPCGALFTLHDASDAMVWKSSWNMPTSTEFKLTDPLMQTITTLQEVVDLRKVAVHSSDSEPLSHLGQVWLAVPLRHLSKVIGLIIVGPPRIAFRTDQEVFDLLGILGQEVGTYIAEQQATESVFQTRSLHDYSKRFAFVAHDIKNISSQLGLLLTNAEYHLANPEFQQDMLMTVRASVDKIDRLLRRLDGPSDSGDASPINVVFQMGALVHAYKRAGQQRLSVTHDSSDLCSVINGEAFDAAVSHIINNALEAALLQRVTISIRGEHPRIIIDITDHGDGMSPEFIRDELFFPLRSTRPGGSGIGAYQARELVREAGGDLVVISELGVGTTMRIVLKDAFSTNLSVSTSLTDQRVLGDARG